MAPYKNNCHGAVSIRLGDAHYSQIELALPLLNEFRFQATVSVPPVSLLHPSTFVDDSAGTPSHRFGLSQVEELRKMRHRIVVDFKALQYPAVPDSLVAMKNPDASSTHELADLLDAARNRWTVLLYHEFQPPQNGRTLRTEGRVSSDLFRRHLRIIRNSGMWVAPEEDIAEYLAFRHQAAVTLEKPSPVRRVITVCSRWPSATPVTVIWKTPFGAARVSGSACDGTVVVRDGTLLLEAIPNKPITIEVLVP